ncbi:hypothetical protein MSAN_01020700 [Mycena sanguinolenta]|uniref:Uncharacterized protein n=1 Tax=Mycena sanguinolenta TaxID=230812 RepID=A0A8H6YTJ8_9AGAR|nr:hypothetical protein MSAN_01020700 [Mycena sanguinolenta]
MFDKFPPEICAHIFEFACTDSGRTGRSLGRVSRYIRQTSEFARYTNIALVGRAQILRFAQFLAEHAHIRVKTRRLFINGQDSKKRMVYAACAGEKEAAQLEYTKMTRLSPPQRESVYAHLLRRKEVANAVESILRTLGPSLEDLDISLNEYVKKFLVNPISLPHSVSLTTRCDFPVRPEDAPLLEPTQSLRYLHIVDSTRHWVCMENFITSGATGISHFAPLLTHLRLSQLQQEAMFMGQLEYALDPSRDPHYPLLWILPPTIEHLLLKPGVERNYQCACGGCDHCGEMEEYDVLVDYARELRDTDRRVVLLKADSTRPAEGSDLQEWLDGGAFDWDASDLDLEVGMY